MIEEIVVNGVATFRSSQKMENLKEVNFLYGANATGKTTLATIIDMDDIDNQCKIKWLNDVPLKRWVYNRHFIEANVRESNNIKGIFTLGEEDAAMRAQVRDLGSEILKIDAEISDLIDTNNSLSHKRDQIYRTFQNHCWFVKQKYDGKLKKLFSGLHSSKKKFAQRVISESQEADADIAGVKTIYELEEQADLVLDGTLTKKDNLEKPQWQGLAGQQDNPILSKKIIGSSDVGIASSIERLDISNWVRQGWEHYNKEPNRTCPFCQQEIKLSIETQLKQYFDASYQSSLDEIQNLSITYSQQKEQLLQALLELQNKFPNNSFKDQFNACLPALELKLNKNIDIIYKKSKEPSNELALDNITSDMHKIEQIIDDANTLIQKQNRVVQERAAKTEQLTKDFWKYLVDKEIRNYIVTYKNDSDHNVSLIERQQENLQKLQCLKKVKTEELQNITRKITSVQPTVNAINNILKSFGFNEFSLKHSENDGFYQIQRGDGSLVGNSLSEGEKSFLSFLYFYHLIMGSTDPQELGHESVVVFDDPVSSLDSATMFVVTTMMKDLFRNVRQNAENVRQVFVFTHNVFFHNEISYDRRSKSKEIKNTTAFWILRKSHGLSNLESYKDNPIISDYQLHWKEIKGERLDSFGIQNCIRRILEYNFIVHGGETWENLWKLFEGEDQQLCRSLSAWLNVGSHVIIDSMYIEANTEVVDSYLHIFKRIFEKTGQIAHYNMMMGLNDD